MKQYFSNEKIVNFTGENEENGVRFYEFLSFELTKKIIIEDFVSHIRVVVKFNTFFFINLLDL